MKKTLSRLPRVVRLAALSAVVLALCSKSSPLYAFNDWMDANIFFTMGRSMLGGRVLYRDVFDHKGPVLYLLYGLAGLVGGTDFRGVLVLEIIAMTSLLYTGLRTAELLAGRRLSNRKRTPNLRDPWNGALPIPEHCASWYPPDSNPPPL